MDEDVRTLLQLMEDSLTFEYQAGAVTQVGDPHGTGWRTLGCLVSANITYVASLEVEAGERMPDIQPGETLLIPPMLRHRITKVTSGMAVSRWSHVNFRVFTSVDVFSLIEVPLRVGDGDLACAIGDVDERLAAVARAGAEAGQGVAALLGCAVARKALGLELLRLVLQVSRPRARAFEVVRAAQRLLPALAAIERDLAMSPRSVHALGRKVGLSRSRMQTLFHDAFGVSPMRYLRRRRLERARQLLVTSDLPVGEVAGSTGFADQFHFSRAFKAAFGRSPRAFRQQARRLDL